MSHLRSERLASDFERGFVSGEGRTAHSERCMHPRKYLDEVSAQRRRVRWECRASPPLPSRLVSDSGQY